MCIVCVLRINYVLLRRTLTQIHMVFRMHWNVAPESYLVAHHLFLLRVRVCTIFVYLRCVSVCMSPGHISHVHAFIVPIE